MVLWWDDLSDQFVFICGEWFGMQRCSRCWIVTNRSQLGNWVSKWAEVKTEYVFTDIDELLESCGTD